MLSFATSCHIPDYRAGPIDPPTGALQSALLDASDDALIETNQSLPSEWWLLFDDPQLANFIQTAFSRNPTLQIARTNVLTAIANANKMRAALYPNITWGADVSKQKLSETGLIPFNTSGTTVGMAPLVAPTTLGIIPVYFTQTETELALTYDFDIWEKNRNTFKAALSDIQAKLADQSFTQLELGISVAATYFLLQIDYKREKIAQALVENQTKYLKLVQARSQNNLESKLNVQPIQINLASAQQSLLQIQGDIAINEYQLKAYLAGSFEESIDWIDIERKPLPKVPLPGDLPLHLIAHRPDIIAQLWIIESAGRQIEVAKAGFYPDFNLTALIGYQTIHIKELFEGRSVFYNVDPALSLPVFDGGRLRANLLGSQVDYDRAIYQYNQLVLNAAKEVLAGIAVLRNVEQQLIELKKITTYQENQFRLTDLRMKNSIGSALDYLTSERNMLLALDQETIVFGNTLQSIISLIKALGGGYEAVCFEEG